ncbi:spermatogenesis-associated protein 33 [Balaenoptera musculus]|uniref:Spermatogenesis-associated protein 33 n=1 Tax=Balaenoptera musculus TaxID=9771 RepID=A0A8B8VU63_BALMU|nr:spermatogenesis-associated protein 33 [Balaenoptera musculus]
MGLSKSKHKLRKGGEPKSGRTYSIPKATERPVDRPSQESEKPPDTKPAESFREKKGAAKRQWPSCLAPAFVTRAARQLRLSTGMVRVPVPFPSWKEASRVTTAWLRCRLVFLCSGPNTDIVCFTEEFFHRLMKYLDVFFLLEKPDVNSEKKKFAIPQIVVTTASKETLISYGSTGMEEQRTIRERAEPGPFYRHRNPSTVDAYNSQTKE